VNSISQGAIGDTTAFAQISKELTDFFVSLVPLGRFGLSKKIAAAAPVRSFARGWTMELKDRKIRVNSMSPGPIETPALEKAGLTAEQAEHPAAQFASQVPLGRRGKPEGIAAVVVFLASDESSYELSRLDRRLMSRCRVSMVGPQC
jgi:Enoyl-(Acyl carrier protein) reductase